MDENKLQSIPLFASFSAPQLRDLAQDADEVDVPEGKALLREGAFAYEFMVIESGQAEVTRDGEHVADLGPGDFLGEIAALERGRRNATVTARSPMTLAVISAQNLRRLADSIPELDRTLRATAAARHPLAHSG
jgi:CRP-like cAMP-binding protein